MIRGPFNPTAHLELAFPPFNTHNALLQTIMEEKNWKVDVPIQGLNAQNLSLSINENFLTVECQVSYTSGRILKRNVKWAKKLRIPEHVDKSTIEAHFSEKLLNIRGKLL